MPGALNGNALLGLLSAAIWGVGDFSGGMGVKRAGASTSAALRVVLFSHIASFAVLLTLALLWGGPFPHGPALLWGLIAGVAGGLSLSGFYIALARGSMGASAAISGVLAAAIPVAVGMLSEGSPGAAKIGGFIVAGLAIWLIGGGESEPSQSSTTWLAIAAGAGFGLYFVALKHAGSAGWVWPMATARMGSISTCSIVLLALRGTAIQFTRRVAAWILATALFDTCGNLLFVAATRAGRLDVAAVLASLYPATTILMAAAVLRERPTRRQIWGMGVALVAVLMIAG